MILKQLFSLCLLSLLYFTSCADNKKQIKQTKIDFTKEGDLVIYRTLDSSQVFFDIEIADTNFDIQTGLMYRDELGKSQGMLFVFNDEQERYFYMKNTKIPLDLIYINAKQKIVSFQKNAKPFNEASLPSNALAKYVLEINAGLTDQLALNINDSISFTIN